MLDVTRAYGLDFLFPARDEFVGASLRDAGEFARPEMEIISLLMARTPGSYVDVGANIGSIALPVAALHPQARVVAIEANRRLATILAANALGNRLLNVEVHHAAAGAEPGLIEFPAPPLELTMNFGGLHVFEDVPAGILTERTRVCTLDEVAPAETSVIKIDVEGFEPQVLAGATRLFAARRASWIVEHKSDERSHAITRQFLEGGYRLFWLFAPFATPLAAKRPPGREEALRGDGNLLALPSGEPPVPMREVSSADDARPTGLDGYPYLSRYGF